MVSKCRVGQPVLCKFFIKNISEEVHSVYVSMGYEVGKDERSDFLQAGESCTKVDLMPFSDVYPFTFTFVPLKLGILQLP